MNENLIFLDDTKFVYRTNLAGDPSVDGYGSDQRNCNLAIPADVADQLVTLGVEVKQTKPSEKYPNVDIFTKVIARYDAKYPPEIYLVENMDQTPELLTPERLEVIDRMRANVYKVQAIIKPYYSERHRGWCVYLQKMYVYMNNIVKNDPFAAQFNWDR